MKNRVTLSIAMIAALFPILVLARTLPGLAGRGYPWADEACFADSGSARVNTCNSRKSFLMPLPIANAGAKTVYVNVFSANPAYDVGCLVVAFNRESTVYVMSRREWIGSFGTSYVETLTGASVPNGGSLYLECQVDPGGQIQTVTYNE